MFFLLLLKLHKFQGDKIAQIAGVKHTDTHTHTHARGFPL